MATTSLPSQTLIPPNFLGLDVPTQRRYALSLGILLQAIKLSDLLLPALTSFVVEESPSASHCFYKWIITDAVYIIALPRFRIPKLTFAWQASCLQLILFWTIDFLLFGPWSLGFVVGLSGLQAWYSGSEFGVRGYKVQLQKLLNQGEHLQGQYTVVMAPISTLQLNPYGESFCLSSASPTVDIPVLFNNTIPQTIRIKRLLPNGQSGLEQVNSKVLLDVSPSLTDDLDLDHDEFDKENGRATVELHSTESMRFFRVSKIGTLSIDYAGESRIHPGVAKVVPCPTASFAQKKQTDSVVCEGENEDVLISVTGVPPLKIVYHSQIRGHKEEFSLEGIQGDTEKIGGQIQNLSIPLSVKIDALGIHYYVLDDVKDGLGNVMRLSDKKEVDVIGRASFNFKDCGPGRVASLLTGKVSEVRLPIALKQMDLSRSKWTLEILHQESGQKEAISISKTSDMQPGELNYVAKYPGTYEIIKAQGDYCQGIVLSPETCRVVEQPLPRANISWQELHECSADTGIVASLLLHGQPPFTVTYMMKYDSNPWATLEEHFTSSRGKILLQPEEQGRYQYIFKKIGDAYYKDVEIIGAEKIEQTVRPLASAQFSRSIIGRNGRLEVSSCEGSIVELDVDLKGTGPWALEIQMTGSMVSELIEVHDLKKQKEKIVLQIPREIDESGGSFQIDLVSVNDAKGCKRSLAVPGVSVHVPRIKATAKFYTGHNNRIANTLEDELARLPLRLTGNSPWTLKYYRLEEPERIFSERLKSPNDNLIVNKPGVYVLQDVRDAYCIGTISPTEATYNVTWIPRPSVTLVNDDFTVEDSVKNIWAAKRAVCQGEIDYADFELTGRAPYQLQGNVERLSANGNRVLVDQFTLHSVQKRARLELFTSVAGHIQYRVNHLGDTSYPLKKAMMNTGDTPWLTFHQDVLPRPHAFFRVLERLTYCLYDTFRSEDIDARSGIITLHGTSPFYLELSLHSLATGEVRKERVKLLKDEWRIELPDYRFETVGSYMLVIDSVWDASSCEQEVGLSGFNYILIDVAETAAIVPLERREDYCVGDMLRFQLEGNPPWRIGYSFNGENSTVATNSPYFHRVADSAGIFAIHSLAHQSNKCYASVDNIKYIIRKIPSARVSEGTRRIREGERAEIVFNLVGEPPFTFTYQRTEVDSSKRSAVPRVLESHTITGVHTTEYSIFSSQEGTWTVTFIADRYCKYPVTPQEQVGDIIS